MLGLMVGLASQRNARKILEEVLDGCIVGELLTVEGREDLDNRASQARAKGERVIDWSEKGGVVVVLPPLRVQQRRTDYTDVLVRCYISPEFKPGFMRQSLWLSTMQEQKVFEGKPQGHQKERVSRRGSRRGHRRFKNGGTRLVTA